jgi:hypothetical protein
MLLMWVAVVKGIFPKTKLMGTPLTVLPLMVAMVIHLMLPPLTEVTVMNMLRKNPIPIK